MKNHIKIEDFWPEFYSRVQAEMKQENNVVGTISFVDKDFCLGAGYQGDRVYGFLDQEYREGLLDDTPLDTKESLENALFTLTQNMVPFPVSKINGREDIYDVQIGDFKKKKKNPCEIFRKKAGSVITIPQKRELLEECWPNQYGRGKKTDLKKRPAWRIDEIFKRKVRGKKNKRR